MNEPPMDTLPLWQMAWDGGRPRGRSLCVCVCLHGREREKEEGGFLLQQGKEWDFQFSVEDNDKGGYQKGLKLHMLPGYQKIKGFTN